MTLLPEQIGEQVELTLSRWQQSAGIRFFTVTLTQAKSLRDEAPIAF